MYSEFSTSDGKLIGLAASFLANQKACYIILATRWSYQSHVCCFCVEDDEGDIASSDIRPKNTSLCYMTPGVFGYTKNPFSQSTRVRRENFAFEKLFHPGTVDSVTVLERHLMK